MRGALAMKCAVFALLLAAGPMLSQASGADLTEKQAVDLIKAANDGKDVPGVILVVHPGAADPPEVMAVLQAMFGRRGAVLAFDAETGSLVMAGPKETVQVMQEVIVRMDEAAANRKKAAPGEYSPVTLTIRGAGTIVVDDKGFHVHPAAETQPPNQPASAPRPDSQPAILFAGSGQNVEYAASSSARVVLRAFGRVWAESKGLVIVDTGRVVPSIAAPEVRVPTVFTVTPPDAPDKVLAQLVVYPDRKVEWDKNLVLVAHAAPAWFVQWSHAIGLPVMWTTKNAKLPVDLPKLKDGQRALLILGHQTAGTDLPDVAKLAGGMEVNILVLEAGWFGEAAGPVSVAPPQMLGGLAEIAKQRWPQPLKFATRRRPWPGIANRWAWIVDANGLPLVEQIRTVDWPVTLTNGKHFPEAGKEGRFTLSYIPWYGQLGRRDQADEMLLALLAAAANRPEGQRWYMPGILHPKIDADTGKDRPVLARVMPGLERPWNHTELVSGVAIIDLRGKDSPPNDLLAECKKPQAVLERTSRPLLLILGDDKMLDEWEWLKLDRQKKTINRPGVVWLSDDELPPSKDNQVRLMLKLTELGVPLAPTSQEEKKQ